MKFSTTPILLTSLALSSTASFGAPLPPVPGANTAANGVLDIGTSSKLRSPNPNSEEYKESPRPEGSPLLGLNVDLSRYGNGNGNSNGQNGGNGYTAGNGGLGLDVNLGSNGGLIGIGGMGRPNKRQLPSVPSASNPTIPTNAGVPIPTSVPMVPQAAKSGLDVADVTGLPQGVAAQGINGAAAQASGLLGGVTGQATGLLGGVTGQGIGGLPLVGGLLGGNPIQGLTGLTNGLPLQGLTGGIGGVTSGLPLGSVLGGVGGLTGGLPLQGLTSTVGGLTNGLPIQGLTSTVGGLTNDLPLQGLTSTVGGLANGLPLQGLTGTVGGLTNGLPIAGLTNTVGGLTSALPLQGLTGTLNGLTSNLPLQGVTSTVGGLTKGLPVQGLTSTVSGLTSNGPLVGLTQPVTGLVGSLNVNNPSGTINNLSQDVSGAAGQVANTASTGSPALGNIVQSLGSNTYLLSTGQILRLASDSTPSTAAPVLNGLRTIEVEGKIYIINPLGQLVGTLTSPSSTVGLYSDTTPNEDNVTQQDNGDGAQDNDGWNSPIPGLLPLSSQPDAIDLVASQMRGYEPPKSYLSASPSSTSPDTGSVEAAGTAQDDTLSQTIPQPDSTWGQMTGSRMTTSLPTSNLGIVPTATSTLVAAITASATATLTPAEGWGEWVTGTPTALPTAFNGGDWTGNDDGAVGSEMVPQTSSGLA
ncbi:hypothetical protein I302_101117 [Kwoniella bestiolae CBS 10118]|uniref:Uncharacterized protein n=1 Tax=Kwoniella bestiolae CBS 10118 TaxID=1296100 RepID=A0A1B9G723_9TREE|nr:hypothetical protein I302_04493 [Kwoniella bestiolae CBS 10118]OCF26803.1 hypothetical protein I302_04493 [Kwoniella bestiolae CBS 10118]